MSDLLPPEQFASIDARLKKIERFMLWSTIFGTLRFLLIAIPIVLAVIFIPPVVKKYFPLVSEAVGATQQLLQRAHSIR